MNHSNLPNHGSASAEHLVQRWVRLPSGSVRHAITAAGSPVCWGFGGNPGRWVEHGADSLPMCALCRDRLRRPPARVDQLADRLRDLETMRALIADTVVADLLATGRAADILDSAARWRLVRWMALGQEAAALRGETTERSRQ